MSHIHSLTSHLKNTTITPAPIPHQAYQSQHGMEMYRTSKLHQNTNRMVIHHPHPPSPSPVQGHPQMSIGRKGSIINAILPNTTTLTRTPSHFTNSAQIQFQPQYSQLQHQLRKPPILVHPQPRGPSPPFVNNIKAHQAPHKSGIVVTKYPPSINSQNQANHNKVAVVNNNHNKVHQNQIHHGKFNSPPKSSQPSSTLNNNSTPHTIGLNHHHQLPPKPSLNHARNSSLGQNSNSGGAARVQHVANHGNQNRRSIGGTTTSADTASSMNTVVVTKSQSKKPGVVKAVKAPPPPPKIMPQPTPVVVVKTEEQAYTPEPEAVVPQEPRPFQKGDDVLFTTDDGTFMFGTVGMIHGQTLQILFGDGTQQLASFNKVKLLSCSVQDDDDDETTNNQEAKHVIDIPPMSSNQVGNSGATSFKLNNINNNNNKVSNSLGSPNLPVSGTTNAVLSSEEVTCGSCGVVKKVAGKKALNYAPHTKTQFNCRRCVNKSRFCKGGSMSITQTPSTPNRGKTANTSPTSSSKSGGNRQSDEANRTNICFHCEKKTNYNDRLHCNLCERACHLSCLAMTPTPLEGDRFWDVICSACGTQNGDSGASGRTKVFSCRRSITSWSDVVHLVISCLASQPENLGERFFDLDKDVIPFIAIHTDRLHLPRTYKNIQSDSRKEFLSTALHNATLRFLNGAEVQREDTLWAIRENNNHQGYPLRVIAAAKSPQKNKLIGKLPAPTPSVTRQRQVAGSPVSSYTPGKRDLSPLQLGGTEGNVSPRTVMPILEKYDTPFVNGSSPAKSNKSSSRLMSQTERLVQKAKKQCQQKKLQEELDSNKRKASEVIGTPESKRLKLSPDSRSSGVCLNPKKTPSPISSKQVSEWLQCLNAANGRSPATPASSTIKSIKGSPFSLGSPSLFGKAVKSAGITPPGNLHSPDKPSLRVRKPKMFDLGGKEKDKSSLQKRGETATIQSNKTFAKLKGRLAKNSNAATQRFSQIPAANGAVPTEEVCEFSEFSLLNSSVEDLINHGFRYTINCLPKAPETMAELKLKVAEAYAAETSTPPAYLNSGINGAKSNRREKSKRDLKNLDSYEITGKWVNSSGIVRYHCEWNDGYGNENDAEDDAGETLLLEWDDLDDADLLLQLTDDLPVITDIHNGKCGMPDLLLNPQHTGRNRSNNEVDEPKVEVSKLSVKNEKHEVIRSHPFFVPEGLNFKKIKNRSKEDNKIVIDLTSDD